MQFTDKQKETCTDAWETFGQDAQILKAVEECNELATALMHMRDGKATNLHVANELADVLIMIEQLSEGLDVDLDARVHAKMARLYNRVQGVE